MKRRPRGDFTFYLGAHQPIWISEPRLSEIALFISRNRIASRKKPPPAGTRFALDSGGFTELQKYGRWSISTSEYVSLVEWLRAAYGESLLWVAPQDWMCEPAVIAGGQMGPLRFVGTKLSVEEHQRRTVRNFVDLRNRLGDLVVPVLQGWKLAEYWRCEEMYLDAGVDLASEPLVCVGSVCRRQSTKEAEAIVTSLASTGLRLHGFGFKRQGIVRCARALVSADSMSWSFAGRKRPNLEHEHIARSQIPGEKGKPGAAEHCSNCLDYALDWYGEVLQEVEERRST